MKRKQRLWVVIGFSFILASGLAWTTRLRWLPEIGMSLDVSSPLRYAPVVLILPGDEETRPFVAAGLMNAGYADRALVPETRANSDVLKGVESSTSEITRQILIRRGIPEKRIVTLSGASDSTLNDAWALNRYFQQFGATDVLIVTSAYHSRRARWTFRHVLPEHQSRLRFYTAPNEFDSRTWWTSRTGRQTVLSEHLKSLFYLTYHGQGWLWCVVSATVGGSVVLALYYVKGSGHV